jgi:putative ABC transport system ATP-binding protein
MAITAESKTPILQVKSINKKFKYGGGVIEAVKDVSMTVNKGEFVAVMGASGSGKSTLLHLVGGLTRPDAGGVSIAGTDINLLSDHDLTVFRRTHIGLIFQAFNLIPSLSGRENIALPILLGNGQVDESRIDRLVKRLGIEAVSGRRPDSMSGGEQQRIAIGRALATEPPLILADEPTGSLDSVSGRKLCDAFRELCEENGTTVLMVTHNPVVAHAASRVVILKDGGVVSEFFQNEFPTVQALTKHYIELIEKDVDKVAP